MWNYYESIAIGNPNSVDYTGAQIKIVLSSGFPFSLARVDGGDLRFIDGSGSFLPYYIETWNYQSSYAVVWVRLPSLPVTRFTTIYVVWGNPTATYDGNFYFYAGEGKISWTKYGAGTVYWETSVKFQGNFGIKKDNYCDPYGAYYQLSSPVGWSVVLEFWVMRNSFPGCNWDRVGLIDDGGNGWGVILDGKNHSLYVESRSNYSGKPLYSTVAGYYGGNWYRVEEIFDGPTIRMLVYNGQGNLVGSVSYVNGWYVKTFYRVYIFGGEPYYVDEMTLRAYYPTPLIISFGSYSTVGGVLVVGAVDAAGVSPASLGVSVSTVSTYGANPLTVHLKTGVYSVEVSAPGYSSAVVSVTVASSTSVLVTLQPVKTSYAGEIAGYTMVVSGTTVIVNSTFTGAVVSGVTRDLTVVYTTTLNSTSSVGTIPSAPVLSTVGGATYYLTSSVFVDTRAAGYWNSTVAVNTFVVSSVVYYTLVAGTPSASGVVSSTIVFVTPTQSYVTGTVGRFLG